MALNPGSQDHLYEASAIGANGSLLAERPTLTVTRAMDAA